MVKQDVDHGQNLLPEHKEEVVTGLVYSKLIFWKDVTWKYGTPVTIAMFKFGLQLLDCVCTNAAQFYEQHKSYK